MKVVSATAFTLDGFFLNATLGGGGATVNYVKLTTAGAHSRSGGERLAVSGVVPTGGALDINGTWFKGGVIESGGVAPAPPTDPVILLTLPLLATGGTYTPGSLAIVGDDALLVVATNPAGTVGGAWKRDLVLPTAGTIEVRRSPFSTIFDATSCAGYIY